MAESDPLVSYTVYERPLDFPHCAVVRVFENGKPTTTFWVGPTVERVRSLIPPGLVCFPRQPNDPLPIIETWM